MKLQKEGMLLSSSEGAACQLDLNWEPLVQRIDIHIHIRQPPCPLHLMPKPKKSLHTTFFIFMLCLIQSKPDVFKHFFFIMPPFWRLKTLIYFFSISYLSKLLIALLLVWRLSCLFIVPEWIRPFIGRINNRDLIFLHIASFLHPWNIET